MAPKELAGRKGKHSDGSAKTREAKLGCIFTQTTTDDKGDPVRDKNSTSYFGAIEPAEKFGERLYANTILRGMESAEQLVVIGDGAKWIWNLASLHFPDAAQIVDLYHAKEHVWKIIKLLCSDPDKQAELKSKCFKTLESGKVLELVRDIKAHPAAAAIADDIASETAYFIENADRMQYAMFKEKGWFVGSGVIEAGCKTVIGSRCKQSGMFWSLRGANAIIALRCAELSCSVTLPPSLKAA